MAIIRNGVNGSVSGKAGSVVFVHTMQGNYVRSLPKSKKGRKPSAEQLESRARFRLVREKICFILPLVRLGFAQCSPPKRAYDCAMSYNLREAVMKTGDSYAMNWERFMISKGLPNPIISYDIVIDHNSDILHLTWEYDGHIERKYNLRSYHCYVLLYPESHLDNDSFIVNDTSSALSSMSQELSLVKRPHPVTYHAYAFFFAHDGSNKSTDSKYLGVIQH